MNYIEVSIFILYLAFMLIIGVYFFVKSKQGAGDKEYFLGGRKMSAWVSGLSAGASDMSAWVLMGLPTSVYSSGLNQMWIPIGLALGYSLSWVFIAPRLRSFSIVAKDSITVPQYLTNRFNSNSSVMQIICAVIFLLAYTVYCASSIKACGTLFSTVIGMNAQVAMYLAAFVIISYTFLGGFNAVCWTDFFQALLILGALLIAPIFACSLITPATVASAEITPDFLNPFSDYKAIISGFAWGLGYFGMPHIIIRFMSIDSQKSIKKSAIVGICWTVLILVFALLVGIIGRYYLGLNANIENNELVFIEMVRHIFHPIHLGPLAIGICISGLLLAAVLAASMSTADSQLLSAASSFAADVYKPFFRKNKIEDKEMLWTSRIVVLIIAIIALIMAANPNSGSIMSLVSNAWGVFGAAFGPVILISLFWKKLSFAGAFWGIVFGAAADIAWYILSQMELLPQAVNGIYEILPGFIVGLIVCYVVSLMTQKNNKPAEEMFEKAVAYKEE